MEEKKKPVDSNFPKFSFIKSGETDVPPSLNDTFLTGHLLGNSGPTVQTVP